MNKVANHLHFKLSCFYLPFLEFICMDKKIISLSMLQENLISFSESFSNYFVGIVDIVKSTKVTAFLSSKKAGFKQCSVGLKLNYSLYSIECSLWHGVNNL